MNTERLMAIALEMADLAEIPGDSAIHYSGDGIRKTLIGIDLKQAELKMAKDLGFDCAIAHHPSAGSSMLRYHEVLLRHVDQMTRFAHTPEDAVDAGQQLPVMADAAPVGLAQIEMRAILIASVDTQERHETEVVLPIGRAIPELGADDQVGVPEEDTPGTTGPYRARKRSLREGGVRVPGLMTWPAKIKKPMTTSASVVTSDYLPTVLDALGLEPEHEVD